MGKLAWCVPRFVWEGWAGCSSQTAVRVNSCCSPQRKTTFPGARCVCVVHKGREGVRYSSSSQPCQQRLGCDTRLGHGICTTKPEGSAFEVLAGTGDYTNAWTTDSPGNAKCKTAAVTLKTKDPWKTTLAAVPCPTATLLLLRRVFSLSRTTAPPPNRNQTPSPIQ